ncbi:MAG: hypothetical protein ABIH39_03135, partial [Candidatus Margulisiibacteriota bacterium]
LSVTIDSPVGRINIGTLHLLPVHRFPEGSFMAGEIEKYYQNITKTLLSQIGQNTIICGDFNNNPDMVEKLLPEFYSAAARVPFGPNHVKNREFSQTYIPSLWKAEDWKVHHLNYSDHEPSIAKIQALRH